MPAKAKISVSPPVSLSHALFFPIGHPLFSPRPPLKAGRIQNKSIRPSGPTEKRDRFWTHFASARSTPGGWAVHAAGK